MLLGFGDILETGCLVEIGRYLFGYLFGRWALFLLLEGEQDSADDVC